MTPEDHDKVVLLLGPWLAGASLELLLQGVVYYQLSHYIARYQGDSRYNKLAVAGLALITTLKSIQSFAIIWITFIERFADIKTATTLTWLQTGNPLMVSAVGFYVQAFFCYRLYIVSSFKWIVGIIGSVMVSAFISVILETYFANTNESDVAQLKMWFAIHLSTTFAGDLLLSSSMIFFLIKKKSESLKKSSSLISALIRLTFQSASPAAICALINLIFAQIYPRTGNLIVIFNMMLPKLYAISMMWTLNARQSIRSAYDDETTMVTATSRPRPVPFSFLEVSKHRAPVEPAELTPVELKTFSSMGWTESVTNSSRNQESVAKSSSDDIRVSVSVNACQDNVKRRG